MAGGKEVRLEMLSHLWGFGGVGAEPRRQHHVLKRPPASRVGQT